MPTFTAAAEIERDQHQQRKVRLGAAATVVAFAAVAVFAGAYMLAYVFRKAWN